MTYTVSWFSAGVSSAVATRLAIDEIDEVIYTHIDDQHPDTMRFVKDCEAWFGKPITILQSHYRNVETAWRQSGCRLPHGVRGFAPCTGYLKKRVRREWEVDRTESLVYVWGMDCDEARRVDGIERAMPDQAHRFPLIDQNITKEHAHEILRASGVRRPAMYDMGYHNNNCVGCVKGGMGYWNKIRVDFPEVFEARAKLERVMGASCIKGVFLDELDPNRGRHAGPVCDECGLMCELQALPSIANAEREVRT